MNNRSLISILSIVMLLIVWQGVSRERKLQASILMLQDGSNQVRLDATEALAELGDARALNSLAETLYDSCEAVRIGAVKAVRRTRFNDGALPELIHVLKDESCAVRQEAAAAIGEIRDISAVSALLETMTDDPCENAQVNAIQALGQIGDLSAAPALLEALKVPEALIQTAALRSLTSITRKDFGLDYDQWGSWLEEQHARE